ncbi:F-box domain-containing protein [Hirschfeldia incana]|nr:F-box domain-containing protein [Hirschfeldia incana]
MADYRRIKAAIDRISNLPDEILQHILCFIPMKLAITTSLLSRRWRHVWCEIPSLSLDVDTLTAASVNKTLTRYTALNTKSFHLTITAYTQNVPYIDRLIKFAMSHNVENLSLDFLHYYYEYKLPDFFCNSSSVKQLEINLSSSRMIVPECSVFWTSLHKLSLSWCRLSDDSMAKILSGCPVLEYLTLCNCYGLKVLDLSKSLHLRTLDVKLTVPVSVSTKIVAPHIHCLRFLNYESLSCTLVNVDSLTEAKLEVFFPVNRYLTFNDFRQVMVSKMLERLQNAEKLTFWGNFIQLLSLVEIHGVPFPMFKVKSLTLDTKISQYAIPGMERLLQNSPDLEKLTVRARNFNTSLEKHLDKYLKIKGFNLSTCWRSKDGASWSKCCVYAKSKNVASLVELVLKNTNKLDKMVVLLDEPYLKFKIKDVMVPTLPRNKNVNVVLSTTKLMALEKW